MKRNKLVTNSLGIKTSEKMARKLDDVLKALPTAEHKLRRKSDTQVTDLNQTERSEVSLITTNAMDRDREIILPDGIDYSDFQRYGTVLFGHEQAEPCGKCVWIKTRPDALLAKTSYPRKPADYSGDWCPDFVWSMINAEVLKGKSIGFVPTEYRDPTPEELALYPDAQRVITKSWLLEYSVVSAPCNPLALVEQIGKGVGLSHWGWKVIGRVKKKQPPQPKKIDRAAAIRKGIEAVKIDYERIAEEALERYKQRWGV